MIGKREWTKTLWHAKRIFDENSEIESFEEPVEYSKRKGNGINYQPMSGYTDTLSFGENVRNYQKALVPSSLFYKVFQEGDKVYIDGVEYQSNEAYYGEKANYVVDSVRNQNLMILVIFKKITKGAIYG